MTTDPAPADIQQLLQRGLDYFGRNRCEDAIECWKEVCRRQPGHPEAMDYLESAGVDLSTLKHDPKTTEAGIDATAKRDSADVIDIVSFKTGSAPEPGAALPPPTIPSVFVEGVECQDTVLDCEEIGRLLSQRRYEDVLTLLYAARTRAPKDASLSRSIRHVRERLANEYACRLVDLDRVPQSAPGRNLATALADADWSDVDSVVAREARQLVRLVDGISSYADIVAASPLGQLSTLRGLCTLLERGYLRVASVEEKPTGNSPKARDNFEDSADTAVPSREAMRLTPPTSGMAPSQAATHAEPDPYEATFKAATEAYLLRDFARAIELFSECCRLRPDDRRSQHNLEALMRRTRKA